MGTHSTEYYGGFLVGFFVVILVFVCALIFSKKSRSLRCKYDERQELIRARGFKYAFFTLFFYNLLDSLIGVAAEKYVERSVVVFFGVFLGILVYGIYVIWNDGYFSLNDNPKRIILIMTSLTILNLLIGINHIRHGELWIDGVLSISSVNLMCGIALLIMLIVLLIKNTFKKETENAEDFE